MLEPKLILILFALAIQSLVMIVEAETLSRRYPQDAIKCYSSVSPNEKIICPEGNEYCVKEVMVNATRLSCGTSVDYPLDVWDRRDAKCVYRKCGMTCPEEPTSVISGRGEVFDRVSFCCEGNLCNSAFHRNLSIVAFVISVVMGLLILF